MSTAVSEVIAKEDVAHRAPRWVDVRSRAEDLLAAGEGRGAFSIVLTHWLKTSSEDSRRFIAEILEARSEEVLLYILQEIRRSGYDGLLPAGVVLTGGTAQLPGIMDLGRQLFRTPVRTGSPNGVGNVQRKWLKPENACGLGLLLWAQRSDHYTVRRPSSPLPSRFGEIFKNLLPK